MSRLLVIAFICGCFAMIDICHADISSETEDASHEENDSIKETDVGSDEKSEFDDEEENVEGEDEKKDSDGEEDDKEDEEDEKFNKYLMTEQDMIDAIKKDEDEEKVTDDPEVENVEKVEQSENDAVMEDEVAKKDEDETAIKSESNADAANEVEKSNDNSAEADKSNNEEKSEELDMPSNFDAEESEEVMSDNIEGQQKSPWWGRRRRRARRRRTSRRRGTGCKYIWYKAQCSDGCCYKGFKCRNCAMKLYLKCGKYLYPPTRGPQMSTAGRPTSDQSNWMARHQSKLLHQIVMPGSHHAGINRRPGRHLMDKWDIPQTMSVSNQLKAGVRFMDVRIATGPFLRQPSITHNYKYQDFEKLIKDAVNFLKRHRNEVIVLRLKEGKKDTNYYGFKFSWRVNWRKVDSVLKNWRYSRYVYSSRLNPLKRRLSNLRGKIIICQQRYGMSALNRMICEGSWARTNTNNPNSLYSKMTSWVNGLPNHSTSRFYFLEAICTAKSSDIKYSLGLFSGCKRSGNRALYKYKSLKDLAKECNYKVYQWLRSHSFHKVNTVMTDFINPQIINYIIARN